MTEETAEIQRLDYSEPPPGYSLTKTCGWWPSIGGALLDADESSDSRDDAIVVAWAHYKAHNDPPGMAVVGTAMWPRSEVAAARAAAWAWYDRRHALAARLEAAWSDAMEPGKEQTSGRERALAGHRRGQLWPRILNWSDDQVALHERWLVDSTAEMPEVLHG